jgi:hypothetical protein
MKKAFGWTMRIAHITHEANIILAGSCGWNKTGIECRYCKSGAFF